MGIEEGLGKAIAGLQFKVTKVEGSTITTDCAPKVFDITRYVPFDYKPGQRYFRDIWENGEFVISQETGETYLVHVGGGRQGHQQKLKAAWTSSLREFRQKGSGTGSKGCSASLESRLT